MQLAHLAHGFVEYGGDDAAVGVGRRPDKAALQPEATNEALALLIEDELQAEPGFVAGAATEAVIGELLLFYRVTMNAFVARHVVKMNEG